MNLAQRSFKVAILDLYEGQENQGMRCIREILNNWAEENELNLAFEEFEVRLKCQVPDLSFDAYISTGGPGSPLESVGSQWEEVYFNWLQQVEVYNNNFLNQTKKHVFFICHSFQLACRYYNIGNVCKRKSTSFGVFPMTMLEASQNEMVFEGLRNPFYAVDSRDYQVIEPNYEVLEQMGASILAIEKERPHVAFERAIMAVRFNDYFIGTQFHPEADAVGMQIHLHKPDKKETVIKNHGEAKWSSMIEHLQDPDKILYTYGKVLPNFLNIALGIGVEA